MKTFTIDLYELQVSLTMLTNEQCDYYYINDDGYNCTCLQSIKLLKDGNVLKSALVGASGGGTRIHDGSLIVEGNKLVTCCSDTIFCVGIPELDLQWKTKADVATCLQIFKYQEDYIVHGEVDISRVSGDGKIIWQRSGADIFTTPEGEGSFVIANQYIHATDGNIESISLTLMETSLNSSLKRIFNLIK